MNSFYDYLHHIIDDDLRDYEYSLYYDVSNLKSIVKKYLALKSKSPRTVNMLLLAFINCYYTIQSQLSKENQVSTNLNTLKADYIRFIKDYISTDDASIPFDNDKKSFGTIKIPFIVGPMSFISCEIKKAICDNTIIINKMGFYHCNIDSMTLIIDSKSYIYENAFCGSHIKKLKIVVNDLPSSISVKAFDQIKSIDNLVIKDNTNDSPEVKNWVSRLTQNKNLQHYEIESPSNSQQLSEAVPQELMKVYKAPVVNMKASDYRLNGYNRGDTHVMTLSDGTILRWVVVQITYDKALLWCYYSNRRLLYSYSSDDNNYLSVTYEESKIRNKILTTMFNNFSDSWKSDVLTTNVEVLNPDDNTTTVVQDKLFLPCEKDIKLLKPFLKKYYDHYTGMWLRDVSKTNNKANVCYNDATAKFSPQFQSYFVYPMMWVINNPNYQPSYFDIHSVSNEGNKLSQIDYDKSNYVEISPKEALKQYKEDPSKLRVIVDNKVIIYDKDGKVDEYFRHRASPVSNPDLNNIIDKKTGESWFDAKCLSPNQLFKIADKIYMVSEVDNAKLDDVRLYNKDFYRVPSNNELVSLLGWFITKEHNTWSQSDLSYWINTITRKLEEWNESNKNKYFSSFKKSFLSRIYDSMCEAIMYNFLEFVQYYLDHYNELHSYVLKRGYFLEILDKINKLILEYNSIFDEFQKYNSPETRLEEVKRLQDELEKLQSQLFRFSQINSANLDNINEYFNLLRKLESSESDFEVIKKEMNEYKQKTDEILQRYKDGNLF